MPTLSHNDAPEGIDGFKQAEFVNTLVELIKNCDPPKSIAINGYWGTGKTSTLIQIHKALTGALPHEYKKTNNKTIIPVWFEAWRYQNETVPIVALLQEIRAQMSLWHKTVKETKKLTDITLLGALNVLDSVALSAKAPVFSKIPDIGRQWENEHYETPLISKQLLELLKQAIDAVLDNDKKQTKRLVIFIDDLDRCLPKMALQLLEGIKIYLNLENCVLVFALDQRQIEEALIKALEIKTENSEEAQHHGRNYLEKICQDIHHLPIPTKQTKADYLLSLLKTLDITAQKNPLPVSEKPLEEIKKVLYYYDCLPANPRKIKALSNRIALMLRKGCIQGNKIENHQTRIIPTSLDSRYILLIALAIIYNFYRRLNEQLEKNPDYISAIFHFAQNPDSPDEPMKAIIPSLKDDKEIPTNPSDSNVFRLHQLFIQLDTITADEIKPFLDSHA